MDIPAGATTANTVISGLPVGLHCNVTEPQSSLGYQPISITPSGGVTVGSSPETVTITATNTAIPGALQIIKHLVGDTADEAFRFSCTSPAPTPASAGMCRSRAGGSQYRANPGVWDTAAGANCTVTEPAPPAPLALVEITPTSVIVGAGQTATVTVTNDLDGYTGELTKQITAPAASPVTFTFLLACNDPSADRQLTLTVPTGATQRPSPSQTSAATLACTLSEPEITGWTLVDRTPSNGTITAATPTITFLNRPGETPSRPAELAFTGFAHLGLLLGGVVLYIL